MAELSCDSWFVLRAETGRELQARQHLESRGFETFLPTFVERRRYQGRPPEQITRALFPGYIFSRFPQRLKVYAAMSPHVIDVLMFGDLPATMDDSEITQLRTLEQLRLARPHPTFPKGKVVRVEEGPLRGIEGVVVDSEEGKQLIVGFQMLGRAVKVALDPLQVSLAA